MVLAPSHRAGLVSSKRMPLLKLRPMRREACAWVRRRGVGGGRPCGARGVGCVVAEALRRGWAATSARLLQALGAALAQEGLIYGALPAPMGGCATDLHVAALYGSAADVATLLRCGQAVGAPAAVGPRGATPLHLAATRRDARGAATLAALRAAAGEDSGWSTARDDWGLTPADVAARPPPLQMPTEREFVAWLARANRTSVIALTAIQLLHWPVWVAWRLVLHPTAASHDAAAALQRMHFLPRWLLTTSTLYDVSSGAVVPLEAVPWPAIVAGTRLLVRYSLVLRMPANAVLLLASVAASPSRPRAQAWYMRHFELLYAVCISIEMLFTPLAEVFVCYRALGLTVAHSPVYIFSYGMATLVLSPGFGRYGTFGPCRATCNYIVLLLRLVAFAGTIVWQRATWGAALRSPQLLAQMAMCLLSLASVAPTQRRLCATELAKAKSAAAKREN